MNNDLISREALKKHIAEIVETEEKIDKKWAMGLKYSLKLIDNAPTVFTCNACKNMGNERECVDCHDYSNYVHYEKRPQGEWVHKEDVINYIATQYSEHNELVPIWLNIGDLKGGADMRGKADQLRDCENCVHHSDNGCEVWKCEFEKRSDV